jgi:hypothetical protein
MICENIVTTGIVTDIFMGPTGSIMIDTEDGLITIPVKDVKSFKFNQKLLINVQVSSDES